MERYRVRPGERVELSAIDPRATRTFDGTKEDSRSVLDERRAADRKWYRNLVVSSILVDTLEGLGMSYPPVEEGLDDVVIE